MGLRVRGDDRRVCRCLLQTAKQQTHVLILAAGIARALPVVCIPLHERARGSRVLSTPESLARIKKRTSARYSRERSSIRTSPRNGFGGLCRALPGGRAKLATVACA